MTVLQYVLLSSAKASLLGSLDLGAHLHPSVPGYLCVLMSARNYAFGLPRAFHLKALRLDSLCVEFFHHTQ